MTDGRLRGLGRTLALLIGISCIASASAAGGGSPAAARNVILFIGDGMGAVHRQAAQWAGPGPHGRLAMDKLPVSGWLRTASANRAVTDSAAAATALATGVKTDNGVIGLDVERRRRETILEYARSRGKSVGLVTTTQISHATPAAFAAHVAHRKMMTRIAAQLLDAGVDVLFGGGEDEFLPRTEQGCHPEPGERGDGRNLIEEAMAKGYLFVCTAGVFQALSPVGGYRVLGLFADEGMARPFAPSLADMTRRAIGILSRNPKGFFLMVEGGQIDWAGHENDAAWAIADTLGLDEAVAAAVGFAARSPGETLVVVTADHETGGMRLSRQARGVPGEDGPFAMPGGGHFYVAWSTTGHTGADVPLTATGPFSERLRGVHDNTFLYRVMRDAME